MGPQPSSISAVNRHHGTASSYAEPAGTPSSLAPISTPSSLAPASNQALSAPDLTKLDSNQVILLQGLCLVQAAACGNLQQQTEGVQTAVTCSLQQTQAVLQASKQGRLTGAAASALGLVLRTTLKDNAAQSESGLSESNGAEPAHARVTSSSSSQAAVTASEAQQAVVREAVGKLCEAGKQVAKQPSAAVAKQGVAVGLATLLGATGPVSSTHSDISSPSWRAEAKLVLAVRLPISMQHACDNRVNDLH